MRRKIPKTNGDNSWIWMKILFYTFCLNHEFCLKIFQIFRKLIVFGQNEQL